MYLRSQLLELQHAIILRALDDIKTPALRLKYYREVRKSLEIYAPMYHMTGDDIKSYRKWLHSTFHGK